MDINNFNKVCVVGCGTSGISLCDLLLELGKKVKVSESRKKNCFKDSLIQEYLSKGIVFEFGLNSKDFIKDCDLVVLSPGVDPVAIRSFLKDTGIPCVGEIEFSFWFNKALCVAITGTNGKTTSTYLTHKVLEATGRRVFIGGNIGTPFSSFVLKTTREDIVVLELSSFQLETIIEFHPYVAVLLNVAPDHFDRYNNLQEYILAKMNIFKNQLSGDRALLNKNLESLAMSSGNIKAQIMYFSDEFPNENFSCIWRIAEIFGVDKKICRKVFSEFKGLSHRMQSVRKIKGVEFINDSKATNPASTVWALDNILSPVVLLAGGKDKGLDYSEVVSHLGRVKKVNLFGEAASKIEDSLESFCRVEVFCSFQEAVISAFREAVSGDTVLLSPMCASFDMFSDYKERGDRFVEIVNGLQQAD
ncbi:MAG: Mur ligase family protein [Candidatus Omnitrophica bacterium]|nr:Mur ligase family protein [Candidatus Omnitrophota bacterium]MDD5429384.1 Mur ligase family protein [Candidatus Omnitrophota bacterium]